MFYTYCRNFNWNLVLFWISPAYLDMITNLLCMTILFSIYHLVILMHACAFKLLMLKRANRRKVVKPVYRIFGKRCYLCETEIKWNITIHREDDHYYFCTLGRSCVIHLFIKGICQFCLIQYLWKWEYW